MKGRAGATWPVRSIGEDVKGARLDRQVSLFVNACSVVSEAVFALGTVLLERLSPSWRRSVMASMVIRCSPRHDDTMPSVRPGDRRRT